MLVFLAAAGFAPAAASMQEPRYTFAAAQERAAATSGALSAARSAVDASQNLAESVRALNLPIVSLDAQAFRYEKTLDVSPEAIRSAVQGSIDGFRALSQGTQPTDAGMAAANALARASNGLPSSVAENIWRPTLTLYWPLYTGGQSEATYEAAQAGERGAHAKLLATADAVTLRLVTAYFGQQLAQEVKKTSHENLARFEAHLEDAHKLEQQGMLSKAQRLQVQVARDTAERQWLRAATDFDTTRTVLAQLLDERAAVHAATPLFAQSAALPPVREFIDTGRAHSPQLMQLQAAHDASRSGIKSARSMWMPKVYGFGWYNFNADNAVAIDPDWIIGIGLHYTLFSNVDRRNAERAARAREQEARAAVDQADDDLETLIVRSHARAETERRQFLLLDSSIAAAEENVRVQALGFREGEATATALIDAQAALSIARTQRAAAAFEYDLALAQLLAASGQMAQFTQYLARADRRLDPAETSRDE